MSDQPSNVTDDSADATDDSADATDDSADVLDTITSVGRRARGRFSRNRLRLLFLVVILLSAAYLAAESTSGTSTATEADIPRAPSTANHTVITESGRAGTITAYRPNGSVLYYDNTHTKYFDVDPTEDDPLTVEYAATDTIVTPGPECQSPPCALNTLERVDLRTGETEVLYQRYEHKELAGEWHDIDRINDTHVLVADIGDDQVFVVNTETELITWTWEAQTDFPVTGGGRYPRDWAHINDVEVLDDGRFMVSLRNQDQVVFLEPETGLQEDWTLGEDGDHDVVYEQHNPDFIPEADGGPAIVLSDSENGHVEEFQREDGEWVQTWQWEDGRMQWPRDADRLPNGNTLVVDTHGNRVLEIDSGGEVAWSVESTLPYDAERLETGDESEGGQSARELGYESRSSGGGGGGNADDSGSVFDAVEKRLPPRLVNGVLFVSPVWMDGPDFAVLGVALLTGVVWASVEIRWRLHAAGVYFRWPVYRRRGDG